MIDYLAVAIETLKKMNLSDTDCAKIVRDIDSLDTDKIYPYLESRFFHTMVIAGEWEPSACKGIDLYDEALKFVQDKFYKARIRKDCSGWYVIVATEPV